MATMPTITEMNATRYERMFASAKILSPVNGFDLSLLVFAHSCKAGKLACPRITGTADARQVVGRACWSDELVRRFGTFLPLLKASGRGGAPRRQWVGKVRPIIGLLCPVGGSIFGWFRIGGARG